MVSLAEWFTNNRYKAKYEIGDRVFGYYKKIPFIGSVGNDNLVSEEEGPKISVHLDLPIKVDNVYKSLIIVKHKDIKSYLKDYASDADTGIAGASKTPKSGFDSRQTHQTTAKKVKNEKTIDSKPATKRGSSKRTNK